LIASKSLSLARRRQRRLRLIENVKALVPATLAEQAHEPFAMRVRKEIRSGRAKWIVACRLVEISRHREKTLGAEEPAAADDLR
jgi:hypothetical protein